MKVLLRTNDVVLLGFAEALLTDAGLGAVVLDRHMSAVEGSIGVLPRRLAIEDDEFAAARRVLIEAGLEVELYRESAG